MNPAGGSWSVVARVTGEKCVEDAAAREVLLAAEVAAGEIPPRRAGDGRAL